MSARDILTNALLSMSWSGRECRATVDQQITALTASGYTIAGPGDRVVKAGDASPMIAVLPNGTGVCIGGRWNAWQFRKHPDGGWVSEMPLPLVDPMEGSPLAGLATLTKEGRSDG